MMDTRPSKRQRTIVCSDDDDEPVLPLSRSRSRSPALPSASTSATAAPARPEGIATASSSSLTTRSSRSKLNARSRTSKAAPSKRPSASPSPQKKTPPKPSQSLHSFFQPATEGQRWSSQKFDVKRGPEPTSNGKPVEDDIIEDDYDSYDEIFTQHLAGVSADVENIAKSARQGHNESRLSEPKRSIKSRNPTRHNKRFLLPGSPATKGSTASLSIEPDGRPWAQRFAPSNLDELAVHKRKISDVQKWLEDVFAGRRPQVCTMLEKDRVEGSGLLTIAETTRSSWCCWLWEDHHCLASFCFARF